MKQREIRFRAWIPTKYDDNDNPIEFEMTEDLAFEDYEPINILLKNFQSPLMQFTGLFDKNGIPIYEGDVLYNESISEAFSSEPRWVVQVIFEDASFCLGKGGDPLEKTECSRDMKIIGNIFENQELIKELDQ